MNEQVERVKSAIRDLPEGVELFHDFNGHPVGQTYTKLNTADLKLLLTSYEELESKLSMAVEGRAETARLKRQLGETQEALRFFVHALETNRWSGLHPLDKADAMKKAGNLI